MPPAKPATVQTGAAFTTTSPALFEGRVPARKPDLPTHVLKTAPRTHWTIGMAAWRAGDYHAAHEAFSYMVNEEKLNSWTRSGAAFWAARAAKRAGEDRVARGYLRMAAQSPMTFYGQLAAHVIGETPAIPKSAFKTLPNDLRRAVQGDLSLVHAIIMQESRFNPAAQSKRGARGMMQVMPATARYIDGAAYRGEAALMDASYNIQLGSRYIDHLARQPAVAGKPYLLLAAYNGGPSSLDRWLRALPARDRADPLMIIESFPASETRAFVERVMANAWIYERILKDRTAESLKELAKGF